MSEKLGAEPGGYADTPEGAAYWENFEAMAGQMQRPNAVRSTPGVPRSDEAVSNLSATGWQPTGRQPGDPKVIKQMPDHEMPERRLV